MRGYHKSVQGGTIVRNLQKGLKKSYYKVEQNLYGKIKGKVSVAATIKQNLVKNKLLNTTCQYDEFGHNGLENRLLKKTLSFVQRYLGAHKITTTENIEHLINYITPAFASVSEQVELNDIRTVRSNSFYAEYEAGITLAKRILKRFGYNINNTRQKKKIQTPPFWIDMSKLFELYVLGLLKDTYRNKIQYHIGTSGNELDYLLVDRESSIVIDAKYKPAFKEKDKHLDYRQVSGYARLKKVFNAIGLEEEDYTKNPPVLNCLIIYPDQSLLNRSTQKLDLQNAVDVEGYIKMKKLGVRIPVLSDREK